MSNGNHNSPKIAFIPARGGSKGIPKKNLVALNGKPLVFHTLEAALTAKMFDEIWLSTDCEQISAKCYQAFGDTIKILHRPSELAMDNSRVEDAILFHLRERDVQYGTIVLLQPSSPLRNQHHILEALDLLIQTKADSVISAVALPLCGEKLLLESEQGECTPIIDWRLLGQPRQSLRKTFQPNGAIYITEIEAFLQTSLLYNGKVKIYAMPSAQSIDIDSHQDLDLVAAKLSAQ